MSIDRYALLAASIGMIGDERLLAVAVLVALAGCGTLAGGGSTASPTVTPAPVPEPDLPVQAGVWDDRIDVDRVSERHERTLANTSYTVRESLVVGNPDNASYVQTTNVSVGGGGTPLRIDDTIRTAREGHLRGGSDVWWNGQTTFYRHRIDAGHYTYYFVEQPPSEGHRLDGQFGQLLANLSVVSVREDGDGVIVSGYLTDPKAVPATRDLSGISDPSMTIRIGQDGVIERIAVGYEAEYYEDGAQRVRYTSRLTGVGETSIEPPAWLTNDRAG